MAESRRLSELLDQVSGRVDFPEGPLVVALSGGADSASLGLVASRMGRSVSLLHIDHGLTYSPMMKSAAQEIAERLELSIEVVAVSVSDGPSPEGQARNARYEGFGKAVDGSASLLTGHTSDDQAETVLLNIMRGAGVRGMAGIPPFRKPNIHRPLLNVSRSETREMAMLAGLPFVDDPMNLDPGLRRNALRLQVMPDLALFNSRLPNALVRLAETARSESKYLDEQSLQIPIERVAVGVKVAISSLETADRVVASRAIARAIRELRGDGPSFDETRRVLSVSEGASTSEQLVGGLVASRDAASLVIAGGGSIETQMATVVLTPGIHRLGGLELDVIKHDMPCRAAPIGVLGAVFPSSTQLTATADGTGKVSVSADGILAWRVGEKRYPVSFYQPKENGYLSVYASEESGEWT